MTKPQFKPLPDVKVIVAGLQRMSNIERQAFGKNYYTQRALLRDYPEQFIPKDDALAMPPVNIVRKPVIMPKTVYEPQKEAKRIKVIEV